MRFFKSKNNLVMQLVPQRGCVCGSKSFGSGRMYDVVNCNICGALYYIGLTCISPIAKWEATQINKER